MAKNWAIAVGINKYDYLQPLNYAKRDAELIQQFLCTEAGFERIFFFTDDSPDIGGKSTRPTRANLRRVFLELFNQSFMGAGDNFWFFFSGHGMRHAERDYLRLCLSVCQPCQEFARDSGQQCGISCGCGCCGVSTPQSQSR